MRCVYRQGDSLVKQMKETLVPADAVAMWYLGQEGFALKRDNRIILVDPFFSGSVDQSSFWARQYISPATPEQLGFVDYVLCTHPHLDHMDPDTIRPLAAAGKSTRFVVPFPSVDTLVDWGIDPGRVLGARAGEALNLDGIEIVPVPAAHDVLHQDSEGNYRELSYIIKWGDICIFHGGDMVVYPGLLQALEPFDIDIAMLPINGRDWLREEKYIVGNLSFREAADLGARIGADFLVPMHYDLFQANDENPAFFVDYVHRRYPGLRFHLFQPGERLVYFRERGERKRWKPAK